MGSEWGAVGVHHLQVDAQAVEGGGKLGRGAREGGRAAARGDDTPGVGNELEKLLGHRFSGVSNGADDHDRDLQWHGGLAHP
eukprot:scaffold46438_cov29-Tisochrysis_lutea.AAC.4